jgi:hypothetical protein
VPPKHKKNIYCNYPFGRFLAFCMVFWLIGTYIKHSFSKSENENLLEVLLWKLISLPRSPQLSKNTYLKCQEIVKNRPWLKMLHIWNPNVFKTVIMLKIIIFLKNWLWDHNAWFVTYAFSKLCDYEFDPILIAFGFTNLLEVKTHGDYKF